MRILIGYVVSLAAVCFLSSCAQPASSDDAEEAKRIQAHLSRVSAELASNPPVGLSAGQLTARLRTLNWLDEYRAAGVFPHNHVRPGERVPVFVDPHGTPCAVGYLLLRSGQEDLVETIVREDNFVRVATLEGDLRVAAWLSEVGLTLREAALIQPAYDFEPVMPATTTETHGKVTLGLSASSAALATYAAMSRGDAGAPWAEILLVGASVGHGYMLWEATSNSTTEPGWTTPLNVLGIAANVGSALVRRTRRGSERRVVAPDRLGASVLPGPNGTEFRLTLRH